MKVLFQFIIFILTVSFWMKSLWASTDKKIKQTKCENPIQYKVHMPCESLERMVASSVSQVDTKELLNSEDVQGNIKLDSGNSCTKEKFAKLSKTYSTQIQNIDKKIQEIRNETRVKISQVHEEYSDKVVQVLKKWKLPLTSSADSLEKVSLASSIAKDEKKQTSYNAIRENRNKFLQELNRFRDESVKELEQQADIKISELEGQKEKLWPKWDTCRVALPNFMLKDKVKNMNNFSPVPGQTDISWKVRDLKFGSPKVDCCNTGGSCRVTMPVSQVDTGGTFSFTGYDDKTFYKVPYTAFGEDALSASFEFRPTGKDQFVYKEDSLRFKIKKEAMNYSLTPGPQKTDLLESPQTKKYVLEKFTQVKGFPKQGSLKDKRDFVDKFIAQSDNREQALKWYQEALMKFHKEDLLHTRYVKSGNLDGELAAVASYVIGEAGNQFRDHIDTVVEKLILEGIVRKYAVNEVNKGVQEALLDYDNHNVEIPSLQEMVTGHKPIGAMAYEKYKSYQDRLIATGYNKNSNSFYFDYEGCVGDFGFPRSSLKSDVPLSCFESYDTALQFSIEDLNSLLAELHSKGYFQLCKNFSKEGYCQEETAMKNPPIVRGKNGKLEIVVSDVRTKVAVKEVSTDLMITLPRTALNSELLSKESVVLKKNEELSLLDGLVVGGSVALTGGIGVGIWALTRAVERAGHDVQASGKEKELREKINDYFKSAPLVPKETQVSKDGKTIYVYADQPSNIKSQIKDIRKDLKSEDRALCVESLVEKPKIFNSGSEEKVQ